MWGPRYPLLCLKRVHTVSYHRYQVSDVTHYDEERTEGLSGEAFHLRLRSGELCLKSHVSIMFDLLSLKALP